MLFPEKPVAEKRTALKSALASGKLQRFVGADRPLTAMLIERKGFEGVYVSGGALSADLGVPDIGLVGRDDFTLRGKYVARVTELPVLIDTDTGFDDPAKTVRDMEDAGVAGCHIEDQIERKRCGHLDNKELVPTEDMRARISAAVSGRRDENFIIMARCDAKSVEGMDKALDRMKAYVDAGADAIFPEALSDEKEFETVRKALDVPLLANMTEFGKSKLLTTEQLSNLGYNMVIYPVTTLRLAMQAIDTALDILLEEGTQENLLDRMQTRKELYDLLRYESYAALGKDIFNFKL